ncbi:hypothetical protein Bbelb_109330 [Branchiostoma belcheri]|nr:hypothetical protein Bbelb_109330 [Branchiostoma belcheri]
MKERRLVRGRLDGDDTAGRTFAALRHDRCGTGTLRRGDRSRVRTGALAGVPLRRHPQDDSGAATVPCGGGNRSIINNPGRFSVSNYNPTLTKTKVSDAPLLRAHASTTPQNTESPPDYRCHRSSPVSRLLGVLGYPTSHYEWEPCRFRPAVSNNGRSSFARGDRQLGLVINFAITSLTQSGYMTSCCERRPDLVSTPMSGERQIRLLAGKAAAEN